MGSPYTSMPAETLAPVLAQVVQFARDDYTGPDSVLPEAVIWSAAYVCACFLAQHTVQGNEGVDTGNPFEALRIPKEMSYAERLKLAEQLVQSWGGQK